MKDVLLKIWDKVGNVIGWTETGFPKCITKEDCATEIADMAKAFDEWKDENVTRTYEGKYYISKTAMLKDLSGIYLTYNELFNYWYNKIYMKK